MKSRRYIPLLALLVLGSFASLGFAAKKPSGGGGGGGGTNYYPTVATVLDNLSITGAGLSSDGSTYSNGVDGVQCYISVSKNDADLVTYNTGRTLHFVFDTSSAAWQNSGLGDSFEAEIDFFAINYFGNYDSMGVGTTAQVQMDLEFKVGSLTYELDYQSLAVKRLSTTRWLITSNPAEIGGDPGFTASDQAALNVIRRHAQTKYGAVNMPFRVQMDIQQ
jgi:hypothetical protein